ANRGSGRDGTGLRNPTASVHTCAPFRSAVDRPGERSPAVRSARRNSVAHPPAERLPLPHALPGSIRQMPPRGTKVVFDWRQQTEPVLSRRERRATGVNFTSPLFVFLVLPVVVGVYWPCPSRWQNALLLAVGVSLYAWGAPQFIIVVLLLAAFDWA